VLTYLSRVLFDITEEVLDAPLYYSVRTLCSEAQSLRTPTHAELRSALINAGYQASGFHGAEGMLKTNAPDGVVSGNIVLFDVDARGSEGDSRVFSNHLKAKLATLPGEIFCVAACIYVS
jgi:hypothetical protein